MATTTIFGDVADGTLRSVNASYATADAGGGTFTLNTGTSTGNIGQELGFGIHQIFLAFDTSGIPSTHTITQVDLSLFGSSDSSTTNFVITALGYDWSSGGLTNADWRTSTQLQALTSLATLDTSSFSTSGYNALTSAGAAFNSYINKGGTTYLMLASSRNISGTQPSNDELVQIKLGDETGTSQDPKLVITHQAPSGTIFWTTLTPANSTSSTASLTFTGVTAPVGAAVHIEVSADNSGTNGAAVTTTCADDSAESGTANTYTGTQTNNDPGAANAGVTLTMFDCVLTRALVNDTITVSFSPNALTAAAVGEIGEPGVSTTISVITRGTGTTGASATPSVTTASITNGDYVVGAVAAETNTSFTADSDTSDGSWSTALEAVANTGTVATSTRVISQRKKVTATATQTYNPAVSGTRDWAASYTVFHAQASGVELDADAGSYALTGTAASLKNARKVVAASGSYAVTGSAATLRRNLPLVAGSGSYAVSGQAAALTHKYVLTAAAGSYALTGQNATLTLDAASNTSLAADAGSYSVSGQAATLTHGYPLSAGAGSYAVSGQAAALKDARKVVAGAGSYALTGSAATLSKSITGASLTAGSGSYSLSGQITALYHVRDVGSGAGSYALTGTDAALTHETAAITLAAEGGSYSLTGTAASVLHKWTVTAGVGSYAVSGTDASLERGLAVVAGVGSYSVSGQPATLLHKAVLQAGAGTYALTGSDATLVREGVVLAQGTLTGTDGADSASIVGNVVISGSLAATEGADAASLQSGSLRRSGAPALHQARLRRALREQWERRPEPQYAKNDPVLLDLSRETIGALAATEGADGAAFTGNVVTLTPAPIVTTGTVDATEGADGVRIRGSISWEREDEEILMLALMLDEAA